MSLTVEYLFNYKLKRGPIKMKSKNKEDKNKLSAVNEKIKAPRASKKKLDPEEKITCCGSEKVHNVVVDKVTQNMPNDVLLTTLSEFFKVFGDPTRTKILWALEESELCVCDLGEVLGMTKSAISHQLSTLRKANLVKFRRVGKNVFYSLKDEHVKTILEIGMEHIQE